MTTLRLTTVCTATLPSKTAQESSLEMNRSVPVNLLKLRTKGWTAEETAEGITLVRAASRRSRLSLNSRKVPATRASSIRTKLHRTSSRQDRSLQTKGWTAEKIAEGINLVRTGSRRSRLSLNSLKAPATRASSIRTKPHQTSSRQDRSPQTKG